MSRLSRPSRSSCSGGFHEACPTVLLTLVLALAAAASPAQAPGEASTPVQRLQAMGIELPEVAPPVANYVRAVTTGNLVFLAGHIPRTADGEVVTGKLGRDLDWEQGYEAAKLSAIAMLASLQAEIGDLDRVRRIVRVTGMVNSDPAFVDQSKVINGCSDFLVEVFGERARHARAAVGMASLPLGAAVEIDMIVEIAP